jgi:DNA-binding NarL/FixJ family response regulator
MAYARLSAMPTRILLLQSDHVGALHLRLAIDMSSAWSVVSTIDRQIADVRSLCSSIRAGADAPQVILVECNPLEASSRGVLSLIRRAPELHQAWLAVLGDGEDAEEESQALSLGARTFIAKPERASDLARIGREITRICEAVGSLPE